MQDVKPTRAEELRLKEKIDLAESGYSILEKKRDSLIHSFMERVDQAQEVLTEQAEQFTEAENRLQEALARHGYTYLETVAAATQRSITADITTQNVMGVNIPDITSDNIRRSRQERGYNPYTSSAAIDDAAAAYEELLHTILQYAEIETGLMKLLDEIESTSRRVNALEEKVLPQLRSAVDYVSQRLEESEREETFRMKKIKEKTSE